MDQRYIGGVVAAVAMLAMPAVSRAQYYYPPAPDYSYPYQAPYQAPYQQPYPYYYHHRHHEWWDRDRDRDRDYRQRFHHDQQRHDQRDNR